MPTPCGIAAYGAVSEHRAKSSTLSLRSMIATMACSIRSAVGCEPPCHGDVPRPPLW